MTRNTTIIIAVLAVLTAAFILNSYSQKKRQSSSDLIFQADSENISAFSISKADQSITLELADVWLIAGHDTLQVKDNIIQNFLDRTLTVRRGTVVSKNSEKWATYSVDEATGARLTVTDGKGEPAGSAIFGPSKSDFSRNYVRIGDDPNVYQTDIGIIFQLQPSPTYWGSKPAPPDTSSADS